MMGNVKAFILSICSAVVFATLAGIGKHHGNVDPRTDAGGRSAQDAGLHPPRSFGPVRQRGGCAVPRRRIDWRELGRIDGLWLFARRADHLFPAEDDADRYLLRRCSRPDWLDSSAQPCLLIMLRRSTLWMVFATSGDE